MLEKDGEIVMMFDEVFWSALGRNRNRNRRPWKR
jgi:hypothetical protein